MYFELELGCISETRDGSAGELIDGLEILDGRLGRPVLLSSTSNSSMRRDSSSYLQY